MTAEPWIAVVEAVAEESGVDPLELPPLYNLVDSDVLDALSALLSTGTPRTGTIEFSYHGYAIRVDCDDECTIRVRPLEGGFRT